MIKKISKIFAIAFAFVMGLYNYSYADIITPGRDVTFFSFVFGFGAILVLIITTISFLELKMIVKKQKTNENIQKMSDEEIEKKKKRFYKIFIYTGIVLLISINIILFVAFVY